MEILLGAAIIVLIGLVVFVRRRNTKQKAVEKESVNPMQLQATKNNTPYYAVSIKFADSACVAAKEMSGKRFLSGAAPRLPLADCNVLECRCRFVHHADRRGGSDRRSPLRGGRGDDAEERRSHPDRRSNGEDEGFFG